MKRVALFAAVLSGLLLAAQAGAAAPDDVLGVWLNQEGTAKVEIFRCDEKYCGKLVWLKEPNYPADSKEGEPGTPKLDHNNRDPELRKAPLLGLRIMRDFDHAGADLWKGGTIYDPKNGKTYSSKMTLAGPAELHLRGFIGISLLGRTAVWTRSEP